jgi:hypothetical protein
MRTRLFAAVCLLLAGSFAIAQDKLETKWNCAKPSEMHSLDVGDVPGHAYVIAQGSCTAAAGGSLGEKTGNYTEFQEVRKTGFTNHGYFTTTMDGGDMAYYTYAGSGPADLKKPAGNKWQIKSASGKHKGLKGSGMCSGTRHDDGSSDWTCTGTTTAGK